MPRVAIVGGDGRVGRTKWPDGYDVKTFESGMYGGAGESTRLKNALRSGSFDAVVVLTRWVGHKDHAGIRQTGVPVHLWPRGVGDLAKELSTVVGAAEIATTATTSKTPPRFCPACKKYFDGNTEIDGVDDPDLAVTEACAECIAVPGPVIPSEMDLRSRRAAVLARNKAVAKWSSEEEEALRLAVSESTTAAELARNLQTLGMVRTPGGVHKKLSAMDDVPTRLLRGLYIPALAGETLDDAATRLEAKEHQSVPSGDVGGQSIRERIMGLMGSEPQRTWSAGEVVARLSDQRPDSVRQELVRSFERVDRGYYRVPQHGRSPEPANELLPAVEVRVPLVADGIEARLAAMEESLAALLETTLSLAKNVVYLRQKLDGDAK